MILVNHLQIVLFLLDLIHIAVPASYEVIMRLTLFYSFPSMIANAINFDYVVTDSDCGPLILCQLRNNNSSTMEGRDYCVLPV